MMAVVGEVVDDGEVGEVKMFAKPAVFWGEDFFLIFFISTRFSLILSKLIVCCFVALTVMWL